MKHHDRPVEDQWAKLKIRNKDGDIVPSAAEIRASCFKDPRIQLAEERGTSRVGRTVYKNCAKHNRVEEADSECFKQEPPKRTDCDFPMIDVFVPYWDPCLSKDGLPVLVKSKSHKRRLLRDNNLVEAG